MYLITSVSTGTVITGSRFINDGEIEEIFKVRIENIDYEDKTVTCQNINTNTTKNIISFFIL